MTPNPMPPQHRYNAYMPITKTVTVWPFLVPQHADVAALADRMSVHYGTEAKDLILLKGGGLSIGTPDECYNRVAIWLRTDATKRVQMQPAHRLKRYFPDGPAPEESDMIDVIVVTDSILESEDVLYALPDKRAFKIKKERDALVARMGGLPSPSEGVRTEREIARWANEGSVIHPHRPPENYGPPTALFNPALAKLKHRLKHLDQIGELSDDHYMWSHKFIFISNDEYKTESLREGELKQIINSLIGVDASWQEQLEGGKAIPDAVWGEQPRAILELKNEDGIGGNATLQCLLDFAKILAQPKYKKYVERSICPAILIGIMANHLEISTAIFTDGIYSDTLLSEKFYIDAWQSETVLRVGRIFKALSLGITELGDYYETIDDGWNGQSTAAHLYPDPLPAAEDSCIPRLTYIGKLSHQGKLLREEDEEDRQRERPYALYRAKMIQGEPGSEVDVVVKFTARYNETAHRILAEEHLAPTLHFCTRLVGYMYMVIMDYIEGGPISPVQKPQDYDMIYRDIKAAIDMLHRQDLVFGDLRAANVVSKPGGGAMLIDFDWVGKHEVDRYPASWKKVIERAGRKVLMQKGDDMLMLEMLETSLKRRLA